MSDGVYDTVNVTGEPEYEEPLGGTEVHEHQYMQIQQPEGVYDMAGVAEQHTFSDGTLRNRTESHEQQYMQIIQTESIYDTARVVEQTVFDGTHINPESQYMELKQLEGVYETMRLEVQEVSCQQEAIKFF